MKRLAAQPLVHFLVIGLLIFMADYMINGVRSDNELVLDRDSLITFMQYRQRSADRAQIAEALDTMSAAERESLMLQWLRYEVLYREARSLELDRDDYVIRERLAQKLEYISEGISGGELAVSDQALREFLASHRDDYIEPATISFTHIFIDAERGLQAHSAAEEMLLHVQQSQTAFADALVLGDRYPFQRNYIESDWDTVAAHFAPYMADVLFDENLPLDQWIGPVQSPRGFHLVLLSEQTPARVPDFEAIRSRLADDERKSRSRAKREEIIAELVSRYQLVWSDS